MQTPSFEAIGADGYAIDNFVVNGVGDSEAEIQVMNAAGSWVGDYFWYNEFSDGDTVYPAGWFESDGATPADITLQSGDGVFFYTRLSGVSLQSAGQVAGSVTKYVPSGYSMIGNSTPVAINADDLMVIGVGDSEAEIQVMDASGSWVGDYFWYNEFTDGDTVYPAGWFESDGATPANLTLRAGDTVFFYTRLSGVQVSIPAAL